MNKEKQIEGCGWEYIVRKLPRIMLVVLLVSLSFSFFGFVEYAGVSATMLVGLVATRFLVILFSFEQVKPYYNNLCGEGTSFGRKMAEPIKTALPPPYFLAVEPIIPKLSIISMVAVEMVGVVLFIGIPLYLGLI